MRLDKHKIVNNLIKYTGPIVIFVVGIIMLFIGVFLNKSYDNNLESYLNSYEENWVVVEEGTEDTLAKFPFKYEGKGKHCTLKNTLGDVDDYDVLILRFQYQDVKVKIDGEVVYEMEMPHVGKIKTILGTNVLSIPMKKEYSNKTIELEMESIKPTEPLSIMQIFLDSSGDYKYMIFKNNIPQFFISVLLMVTGIIYLFLYIIIKVKKISLHRLEEEYFLFLFLFSFFQGVWIMADLHIFFLMTGNLVLNDILSYFSFAVTPIGIAYLIYCIIRKYKMVFLIMEGVFVINLLGQLFLFSTGLADFANMLIVSQVLMFASGITVIGLVIIAAIKKLDREKLALLVGFVVFSIFVIICIVGYVFGPIDFNYNIYFLLGMTSIAIDFGYIVLKEFVIVMGEHTMLEQTKKFAYTDALTGVGNRRAYEEALNKEKEQTNNLELTIIGFDVNFLKKANDTLGHAAGDELLIATATIISSVFSNQEFKNVFRTGGDEFSALVSLSKEDLNIKLETLELEFKKWKGEINPSISVAVGYASKVDYPDISLEELSIKADEEMYKNKRLSHKHHKKP